MHVCTSDIFGKVKSYELHNNSYCVGTLVTASDWYLLLFLSFVNKQKEDEERKVLKLGYFETIRKIPHEIESNNKVYGIKLIESNRI